MSRTLILSDDLRTKEHHTVFTCPKCGGHKRVILETRMYRNENGQIEAEVELGDPCDMCNQTGKVIQVPYSESTLPFCPKCGTPCSKCMEG